MSIDEGTKGSTPRAGEIIVHPEILDREFTNSMRRGFQEVFSPQQKEKIMGRLSGILNNQENAPNPRVSDAEFAQISSLNKQLDLAEKLKPLSALQGAGKEDALKRREESINFNGQDIRAVSHFVGALQNRERPTYREIENFLVAYENLEYVVQAVLFPNPGRE